MGDTFNTSGAPAAPVAGQTTTGAAGQAPVATEKLANDLIRDVVLAKQLLADFKAGGAQGVMKDAPQVVTAAEEAYKDVMAALPEIKAGYKTSEFWLIVGGVVLTGLYGVLAGKALPFDSQAVLAGVVAVYVAARALIKGKAA